MTFDVSERYFESGRAAGSEGEALLDALAEYVRRYVVLRPEQTDAGALFVVHTHAVEAAEATPYLSVRSAEKRSGKSLLLDVLGLVVARPLATANISDAALFRAIAAQRPTLLFDEVDAIFGPKARDREDLRGLLNAGYRRGGLVYRMGGAQKTTLEAFEVFCPKALAGIGRLPDTVADRSIALVLKRKAPGETAERFRRRDVEQLAASLRGLAEAWAEANLDVLREARPEIPDALDDRAADVWEPLLAVADQAGGDWPERARRAALSLSAGAGREDESLGVRLLADCWRVFEESGRHELTKTEMLDALLRLDDEPYAEWKNFTTNRLSRTLKQYDVPGDAFVHDENGKTHRGWKREHFADAWARFLPGNRANRANGFATPASDESKPCARPAPHTSANVPNPHEPALRTVRTLSAPRPGDEGFRDHLNRTHAAGYITERERFELRLLHDLVWRAQAAA